MIGDLGPSQIREEFWTQLIDRLKTAGYRPSRRGNYCYLLLGVANTQLVLAAPTGDGGVECKLSLAGAARAGTLTPAEIFDELHQDRDAIQAQVGRGLLEWGSGKSSTRVYLRRAADLGDRRTWQETSDWLMDCAERFTRAFRPRLVAITSSGPVTDGTRPPRRRFFEAAAPPAGQAHPAPATLVADEPAQAYKRSGSEREHAGEIRLSARLEDLAGRFGLVLRRPPSARREAWSLEAQPELSSDHLYRYAYALWWGTRERPRLDDMVAWGLACPCRQAPRERFGDHSERALPRMHLRRPGFLFRSKSMSSRRRCALRRTPANELHAPTGSQTEVQHSEVPDPADLMPKSDAQPGSPASASATASEILHDYQGVLESG